MATTRWRPGATAVAQVTTVTVSAYDAATLYKLHVGGRYVSAIAAGSVNATATALAAAWNAAADAEFSRVTASANTATITLVGDEAGIPFTVTSSETGGTGTIDNPSTTTAATGPYHWSDAANWSGGATPANSDVAILELSSGDVRYGLAQSGVTLAELRIMASYTGQVGLSDDNAGGYPEYRDRYLAIGATLLNVGQGEGTGSPMLRLDQGSVQTAVRVHSTGNAAPPLPPLQWKGTHASNAMYVSRGQVGIAVLGGETATLTTLEVGYLTSQQSDSSVRAGPGLALTTLQQTGGTVVLEAGLTTADKRAGTLEVMAGNITTVTQHAGTFVYRGSGTITTLNEHGGLADFSQSTEGCTVTNSAWRGSTIRDPLARVTWTNAVAITGAYTALTLDLGPGRSLTIA